MAKKKNQKKAEAQAKKSTKRKRAKVVVPKMNNLFKPAGMSLVEWQIALRKQQAEKETFAISQVDEKFSDCIVPCHGKRCQTAQATADGCAHHG